MPTAASKGHDTTWEGEAGACNTALLVSDGQVDRVVKHGGHGGAIVAQWSLGACAVQYDSLTGLVSRVERGSSVLCVAVFEGAAKKTMINSIGSSSKAPKANNNNRHCIKTSS